MEIKKLTSVVVDGVINFAVNSFLNIYDERNVTTEIQQNNHIKVYMPLKINDFAIKEENIFKACLNADLHYMIYIIGTAFVDNEIINRYSLYYLYDNKIMSTLLGISFDNEKDIVFSFLEETDENETFEYKNICTIHIDFENGNIVLDTTFTSYVISR